MWDQFFGGGEVDSISSRRTTRSEELSDLSRKRPILSKSGRRPILTIGIRPVILHTGPGANNFDHWDPGPEVN